MYVVKLTKFGNRLTRLGYIDRKLMKMDWDAVY